MNNQQPLSFSNLPWQWPLNVTIYDKTFRLSEAERAELDCRFSEASTSTSRICPSTKACLSRLLLPIDDVLAYIKLSPDKRLRVFRVLCIEMQRRGSSFWAWTLDEWREVIGPNDTIFTTRYGWRGGGDGNPARRWLPVVAYLLQVHPQASHLFEVMSFWCNYARRIFGEELVDQNIQRLRVPLLAWGYRDLQGTRLEHRLDAAVGYLLLRNQSPYLEDLSIELLETLYQTCTFPSIHHLLVQISRALWALNILKHPLAIQGKPLLPATGTDGSVSDEWLSWCQRWRKTSTLQQPQKHYYSLLKVGRWLRVNHPEVEGPADWNYELAAELVAALNTMKVGQWSDPSPRSQSQLRKKQIGQPLGPVGKNAMLKAMRVFLHDCQEWHWIPVTINPHRAFRTPLAIQRQIGTNPRVIDKDLWAKLLWAAMNLQEEDLPRNAGDYLLYPLEMVRALATVWCFAALRSDEIWRLRVGCMRWQYEDVMIPETGEMLPKDAVCFLDVPVNKTSRAYTKAVHTLVGRRINEWEQVRPQEQPYAIDHKTGEHVRFLFSYRGMRVSKAYINKRLIPLLCRKAGIPEQDSRGTITSHRARATIASQLYNAKEPLSIYELKEYLGHKHLSSTQHYIKVDPTKLASRVAKAGYLEQNMATIEVLLDQEAVMNGAAARGEPWKYYDLGHGYCVNTFWADCKHRMACARCPFYRPKDTTREQLVEGKANLVRMLEYVTLDEDEKLLVTEGIELHQELIDKLVDMPTPAGPTPRELAADRPKETQVIPLKTVQRTKKKERDQST